MDFRFTGDQQLLSDSLDRFVKQQYAFTQRKPLLDTPEGFSRDHWKQFAELGWLAMAVPEDAGGLGAGFVEQALVMEAFGRGLVLEPYLDTAVLSASLLALSDRSSARHLLEKICAGDAIVALAMYEPRARFDASRIDTTAIPADGGHRLNGRKILALGGASATHFLVTARGEAKRDGTQGISVHLVDAAEITVRGYRTLDGRRAADVAMDGVALGEDRCLFSAGNAWEALEAALDHATVGLCAEALGCMEAAMQLAIDYIRQRRQFGRALAEFQVLQHRCAEMFIHIDAARSHLYRTLGAMDLPAIERRRAVSMCKVGVSQAARFVGGEAAHLHGGNGMTDDYAVGHYLRRLTLIEKSYGDTEFHLDRCVADLDTFSQPNRRNES